MTHHFFHYPPSLPQIRKWWNLVPTTTEKPSWRERLNLLKKSTTAINHHTPSQNGDLLFMDLILLYLSTFYNQRGDLLSTKSDVFSIQKNYIVDLFWACFCCC